MDFIEYPWKALVGNRTFVMIVLLLVDTVFPVYVFTVCSKFRVGELWREVSTNKWLMLKVALTACLFTPLVAAGTLKVITVPVALLGIMLVASTAPGDPFDLVEVHGKKGGLLMASALMVMLALLMPLNLPFWMWTFSKWFHLNFGGSPAGIFHSVAPKIIPPILLGLAMHHWWPSFTDKVANVLHRYFKLTAIVATVFFMPFAIGRIISFGLVGALAMFIVTTATVVWGYYLDRRRQTRQDSVSISLVVTLGNMAAVVFVAHHGYPNLNMMDFTITVFGWIVLRWVILWFWYFVMKFRVSRKNEAV